ncbi:predicted protein [Sparassis crispa]|uniref:Uncharacterized protein n=1 Tax=Sparassis crispa TaxID=139825 RepID=A0A401GSY9_9APHY|nr:predicted protein [Sparassis crispa]GBE85326.1 predicted protein [Sparassis crispa]
MVAEMTSAADVYSKLLFQNKYGYPLWIPEPPLKHGEVVVGDVGYIQEGGFYRIFNAINPELNKYGAPEDFKPLQFPEENLNTVENWIPASTISSRIIQNFSVSASAGANIGTNSAGGGLHYKCTEDQGAILVLSDSATKSEVHNARRRIKNYMVPNCQKWIDFKDGELKEDDIRFVSGWVKTSQWLVGAITQDGREASVDFNAAIGYGNASFNVTASRLASPQSFYRTGPRLGALSSQQPNEPTDFPKDQCVFLHYFKLRTRWFFLKKLEAAAKPKDLHYHRDGTDDDQVMAADTSSIDSDDSDILEEVPAPHKPWDPVDFVLDYILVHSEAEVAVASTEDIVTLCDNQIPDDIREYLERTLPEIEVNEDGVGSLSFETFEVNPAASAPEQTSTSSVENRPVESASGNLANTGGVGPIDPSGSDYSPPQKPTARPSDPGVEGSSKQPTRSSKHHIEQNAGGITSLAYSPDGSRVVSGSEDGSITIWPADGGDPLVTRKDNEDAICAIAFNPDSSAFVTAARDGTLQVWETRTNADQPRATLVGHDGFVDTIAFSPNGRTIATGSVDFTVRLWDAMSGAAKHELRGHTAMVMLVQFSPGGEKVASTGADCTARVWDVETGAALAVMRGHEGVIYSLVFSPDTRRILTGADDGSARVWRTETGEELVTLREHAGAVWSAIFSADGKRVLSAAGDGFVKVCDSYSGEVILSIEAGDGINTAAFSNDGKLACTVAGDHIIRVWDLDTGKSLAAFEGHEDSVNIMQFSPDAKRIVSTSDDGTMRIWHMRE